MDKTKLYAALGFFILALIAPLITFIGGGGITIFQVISEKNHSTIIPNIALIVLIGGGLFFLFAAAGIFLLFQIKDISKLAASLPFIFSAAYTASIADALPDVAPFLTRLDDTAAVTFGAVFSFILALKRDKNTPKWILIPLLLAAVYTFLGGIFPSGIDEIIVQALAFLAYFYGISRPDRNTPPLPLPEDQNHSN